MNKKIDTILTLLATLLVASWIVLIIFWAVQTKAYNHEQFWCKKVVWWYCWWSRAVELYNWMRQLWFTDYQSKLVINKCKKFEKLWMKWGVENCVIAVAWIAIAESGWFKHCYQGQCMWVKVFGFSSLSDNLDDWLKRYTKYWYTWRWKWWASFFYSLNWKPSLSRYCTEEQSSWMKRFYCPNWWRHFNYVFNYLNR